MRADRKNPVQNFVQAKNIGIRFLSKRRGMPVHVPFDILNVRFIKYSGNGGNNIIPYLGLCEIQQQFITAENIFHTARMKRPVRMSPVEIGVRIDCFRLKPEAEVKPQCMNSSGQSFKPSRKLLPVDRIVSETGLVAVALTEPAVIQHKQLTSELFCLFGQSQELCLVEGKHTAFPVVIEYRAFPVLPVRRDNMIVYKAVHAGAEPVQPAAGPAQHCFRACKEFTILQGISEMIR